MQVPMAPYSVHTSGYACEAGHCVPMVHFFKQPPRSFQVERTNPFTASVGCRRLLSSPVLRSKKKKKKWGLRLTARKFLFFLHKILKWGNKNALGLGSYVLYFLFTFYIFVHIGIQLSFFCTGDPADRVWGF